LTVYPEHIKTKSRRIRKACGLFHGRRCNPKYKILLSLCSHHIFLFIKINKHLGSQFNP